ncbi:hypothetical protein KR054_004344 [Drosophila jambulina]|nr:hypothetical protein KR054_004344 [Drosophila jambulina]
MLYSMQKKRKLLKILKKWRSKRKPKESCYFQMSCPELDAIMGPPSHTPGVIILHPDFAMQLIKMGIERATECGDRRVLRKLKRDQEQVQTIISMLQVHCKMSRLAIQDIRSLKDVDRK